MTAAASWRSRAAQCSATQSASTRACSASTPRPRAAARAARAAARAAAAAKRGEDKDAREAAGFAFTTDPVAAGTLPHEAPGDWEAWNNDSGSWAAQPSVAVRTQADVDAAWDELSRGRAAAAPRLSR